MNIKYYPTPFMLFLVSAVAFLFLIVVLSSMKDDILSLKRRIHSLEQTKSQVNEMVINTLEEHEVDMEDLYSRIRIIESRKR